MYPGAYKNFDDIEDSLTQEELELMYKRAFDMKQDEYRFLAAIQGVELGNPEEERVKARIEEARVKAYAQLTGVSQEEIELEGMFEFIEEDEIA